MMRRKHCFISLAAVFVAWFATDPAHAAFTFRIEGAPIFATDITGAGREVGPYATIYSASSTIDTTLTSINTGPLADWNATPPLNRGYDYWLKSEWGAFSATINQMVFQLEGTVIAGQGGMLDIMNNLLKHSNDVPIPAGKTLWRESLRISVEDIPFPADPTVLTNSRIQHTILHNHDPATMNDTGFVNITDDDGALPVVTSSFDAAGLDIQFEFDGALYVFDALEDTSLRVVSFFEGDIPGGGGPGPGGDVPEPGALAIWSMLVVGVGLAVSRWRRRQRA